MSQRMHAASAGDVRPDQTSRAVRKTHQGVSAVLVHDQLLQPFANAASSRELARLVGGVNAKEGPLSSLFFSHARNTSHHLDYYANFQTAHGWT